MDPQFTRKHWYLLAIQNPPHGIHAKFTAIVAHTCRWLAMRISWRISCCPPSITCEIAAQFVRTP